MSELLRVSALDVAYAQDDGLVRAVRGASLRVRRGQIVGLVGESGCGKSTLAKAILRVLAPPGVIVGGHVRFDGHDILAMSEDELRAFRWSRVAWVPQRALAALNPLLTIGAHVHDTLAAHAPTSWREAQKRGAELLDMVDLDPRHLDSYPHQLSGGMRQRVTLALALALSPDLLIMDEPTTALDVVVERDILRRLLLLQRDLGFSVLFITHDLPLLLELATHVGVMYAGRMVEFGPVRQLQEGGLHPYTQALLRAIPALDADEEPTPIPGDPASLSNPPPGCRFHPRCIKATPACRLQEPVMRDTGAGEVACPEVLP
jgi:peptide/nickel transport system ATP-binding protein